MRLISISSCNSRKKIIIFSQNGGVFLCVQLLGQWLKAQTVLLSEHLDKLEAPQLKKVGECTPPEPPGQVVSDKIEEKELERLEAVMIIAPLNGICAQAAQKKEKKKKM